MGTQLTVDEPAIRFCINAFTVEGGTSHYASPDENDASLKWNVYARTPDHDVPKGVDLSQEGDYGSYGEAMAAARKGCETLGLDPADIRLY